MTEPLLERGGTWPPVNYVHPEAFCLMRYRCESCRLAETLWNSRDGVTPFIISCLHCGGSAVHTNWREDVRMVDFVPTQGMRIFVDLTKERWREYFEKMQAEGKFPMTMSFEENWDLMMQSSGGEAHPDIIVVPKRNDNTRNGIKNRKSYRRKTG